MELTIPVSFIFGILSFFSPCLLPLVPGYFSILSNTKTHDFKARLTGTILFVLGFSVVFIGLASIVTNFGAFLYRNLSSYKLLAGCLIIYFGLSLIFPKLQYNFSFTFNINKSFNFYIKNIFLGFSFAFGFTPCIGPVLGGLLTLAASSSTVSSGIILLTWYSLGMGLPFIFFSLLYNYFSFKNNLIKSISHYSTYFSGCILFILGSLIALDRVFIVSSFFQKIFYFLGIEFLATI